jgi:DNA polymerase IV (archaeal DinB-like DNA polymerase)
MEISTPKNERQRIIFHVDMDSFYASCELAQHPSWKEEPFIVGADPKEGKGRGVVLACNYPARKFGVRSGMPISRAWQLCSTARYVFPHHGMYGEVSKRVMEILKQFTKKIEQISIDEAFLDFSDDLSIASLSGKKQREDALMSVSAAIKNKIKEQENITCSIGISNSKIVSKIATDLKKPDGLTIVEPDKVVGFLAPLPVEKIPGVGKVTQGILLESFDVKTIGDLAKIPLELLEEKFGRSAHWFRDVALGIEKSEVITNWEPVSQSGETTFDSDESDYENVSKLMKEIATEVHKRTVSEGYLFRNVGIKIRLTPFETHTRSRSLSAPTDSLEIVLKECEKLLEEFSLSGKSVRLIGVRLSSLEEKRTEDQRTLLEWS